MVRIAPIRLTYNPRTLWFDAGELELAKGDPVVVQTARGREFGHMYADVFEATDDELSDLKSPLKPVLYGASPEDEARAAELDEWNREALPVFKQIAAETIPEMNPVSVECLFDGDKAVFYFEAEDRVDFRELVRKLAAEFHVRIDMKQIGVRDEARMIGGYGHCGQELCCKRLGGNFDPVSIRMAKEQDLSLNPQKISGVCGRLMCCLRYEFETYKDFHSRAPKKGAKIQTPDGEGKVTDLDVPREIISITLEGEKPVRVPLADMEPAADGKRPNEVGAEAWERAHIDTQSVIFGADIMLTSQLSADDNLADPTRVRRVGGSKKDDSHSEGRSSSRRSRSRRRQSAGAKSDAPVASEPVSVERKQRRRRSTKVEADGSTTVSKVEGSESSQASAEKSSRSRRRRSRGQSSGENARPSVADLQPTQGKTRAQGPGRNSSNLRAAKNADADAAANTEAGAPKSGNRRRRRRSHKSGTSPESSSQSTGE